MIIKKLSWAGIQVNTNEAAILIDPIGAIPPNMGQPHESILSLENLEKPDAVLITHIHPDHFDPESIKRFFGVDTPVYLPLETVSAAHNSGLTNVTGVKAGEEYLIKDIRIKVIRAVDGFGTPQVSWGVYSENYSLFHAGDTLWHGLWWHFEKNFGPFDIVCLPVNGAVLQSPLLKVQSEIKACMDPEEAVSAAKILGARELVPIHYGTFHIPPYYIETDNVAERLKEAAKKEDIQLCLLNAGELVKR